MVMVMMMMMMMMMLVVMIKMMMLMMMTMMMMMMMMMMMISTTEGFLCLLTSTLTLAYSNRNPTNTIPNHSPLQSFEALQLHGQLQAAGLADTVPIAGLFSLGSFARLKSWDGNTNTVSGGGGDGGLTGAQCALMETDSVYAFLAKQPTQTKAASAAAGGDVDKNTPALSYSPIATGAMVATEDLCTPSEALQVTPLGLS